MTWTTQDKVTVGVRFQMALRQQTQRDVADVLGVSQVSVSGRLNGRVRWSVDDLDRLAAHYGIKVGDLVEPQTPMPVDFELLSEHRAKRSDRRMAMAGKSVNGRERTAPRRVRGGTVLVLPTQRTHFSEVAA